MKTDDIEAVMGALATIAYNITPDVMASQLYGRTYEGNEEYISEKYQRLQDRGIVYAYGCLDLSNQRKFIQLVQDVIEGETIPGLGRWS